ncbi:MAG: amidohydrolase family protein [Clostridia bacterium]|nr:amidohydrolase family protein [Clostridia bacterium]
MFAIDCHDHVYNKRIAPRAVQSVGEFYDVKMNCSGIADELIKISVNSPVKKFVINAVALSPKPVCKLNDFIAGECGKHSEFTGLGTLHPDMDGMEEELERIIALGLHGIKLHPDSQCFDMDCDKAMKMYEKIEGRLPILMHCGDYRSDRSHPKRLVNILNAFPDLTVVGAHFGGWSVFDEAVPYLKDRNCPLDISSSIPFIGIGKVSELIKLYGADRLMFGSDFPMWNPVKEYEAFMQIDMDDDEREKILWKNAARVFNIDCMDIVKEN